MGEYLWRTENKMNEQEYQQKVSQLVNKALTPNERLCNFALGLVGEVAEIARLVDNAPNNREEVLDELSDTRWYWTAMYTEINKEYFEVTPALDSTLYIPAFPQYLQFLLFRWFVDAGQIADCVKKVACHGHPLDKHRGEIKVLLRGCKYYYDMIATSYGFTDEQIKTYNIQKLEKRYQGLEFSTERSLNRTNE